MRKTRTEALKKKITSVINEHPEAKLTKNRYRLMRAVLQDFYPIISGSVGKDTFEDFLREVVFLDRNIRYATEGVEDETKQILSQEYQIREGYVPGHEKDVKHLSTLNNH